MGNGDLTFGTIICSLFLAADVAAVQWAARHKQISSFTDTFMVGFMFLLVGTAPLTRAFLAGNRNMLTYTLIVIIIGYGALAFLRGLWRNFQSYDTQYPIISLRYANIRTLLNSIVLAAVYVLGLLV